MDKRANNRSLPTRAARQSYLQPLRANMKYDLGACTASMKELEEELALSDIHLISRLEMARTIARDLRYTPYPHCEMDLFNLPVKTAVDQINCPL